jgi:hypothetical protein
MDTKIENILTRYNKLLVSCIEHDSYLQKNRRLFFYSPRSTADSREHFEAEMYVPLAFSTPLACCYIDRCDYFASEKLLKAYRMNMTTTPLFGWFQFYAKVNCLVWIRGFTVFTNWSNKGKPAIVVFILLVQVPRRSSSPPQGPSWPSS